MKDLVVTLLAFAAGVLLAVYDLRTDDTAIEVGLLLIASVALAALSPRRWWLIALCIGLPIPLVELASGAMPPAGAVALGFTIVGSLIGFGIRRARSAARS